MKKIGIFYGSSTGYTAHAATALANSLNVPLSDVHHVAKTSPLALADYDVVLLGSSTWGGGELQPDWYDFLDGAQALTLKGKKAALFGCGDVTMGTTFCEALVKLRDALKDTKIEFIAPFDADGLDASADSPAREGDKWIGLVLDDVNHADLTAPRIERWAKLVKESI